MNKYIEIFKSADILLPEFANAADMAYYPVIACDQHTSEPEYWHAVEKFTDGKFSTLNMIVPEIYLDRSDSIIPKVHNAMEEYEKSILREYRNTVVFCERTQNDGRVRMGVICALDLEYYDFSPESKVNVRATEGTVLSRIPSIEAIDTCFLP